MTRCIIIVFALLLSISNYAQQSTPAIFQIQTVDVQGNPVPDYHVLLRPGYTFDKGEIVLMTNTNGYWSDTVLVPESTFNQGSWDIHCIALDSSSTGVSQKGIGRGMGIQPPYTLLDTFKIVLHHPLKGADNCGTYSVHADSVVNDPMFVRLHNNLKYPKTGTTWTYGDGDTGHLPQSYHRYAAAGTYYYCHYTDSCGPVCDSVTVPTKVPSCVIQPRTFQVVPNAQGATVYFSANYPIGQTDSVKWTFSGGFPPAQGSNFQMYMPTGKYQYCVQVNNCPIFCDSISVNMDCQANFNVLSQTSPSGNLFIDNISLPRPNDSTNINYKWSFGDGNTSNQAFPVHTYQAAGTYNLCLEIEVVNLNYSEVICINEYCETISGTTAGFSINVQDPYISLEELTKSLNISIFPNPVNDIVTISVEDGDEIQNVNIYDVAGTRVLEYESIGRNKIHLALKFLNKGIYLLEVKTTGKSKVIKFVKD